MTDSSAYIKLACELLGWQRLRHNLDVAVNKGLDNDNYSRKYATMVK